MILSIFCTYVAILVSRMILGSVTLAGLDAGHVFLDSDFVRINLECGDKYFGATFWPLVGIT